MGVEKFGLSLGEQAELLGIPVEVLLEKTLTDMQIGYRVEAATGSQRGYDECGKPVNIETQLKVDIVA